MKETKRLRIYPKYIYKLNGEQAIITEFRIQGQWLQQSGFNLGEFIRIKKITKGVLIIKNTKVKAPTIEL